ncbi:N-formylglutamate deformylase [Massilia eurypsychrophila]|jgi:N-formylglutamate deformylase|uniref:N-formylglutamate deformylase n=1 Tax=Massilia eurypsychrophila TaxID=1485217 RepID=A0A2G8TJQ7_9BURK|nr:N-formylglutamate deformylase [Massilia eurypsychrophila]PIL46281.1 N-formylglutamate deformylase [Massilia eurypsychrophila]
MDFEFNAGSIPILVSMPHAGADIPDDIAARMAPCALSKADTDWHLPQLYDFLGEMGASTIAARWSRYVIDLNRPPEDTNLYPGMDTTGLCPVDTFGRERLYRAGQEPTEADVRQRLERYWRPYHQQLRAELDRLLALHGKVVLWDAHSIASMVPRFFDGRLPDLNFGTADGASCDQALADAVVATAREASQFSIAVNGRFKGGYITRQYGRPAANVHAIQLEMCQCLYMDESAPFAYRPDVARRIQPALRQMVAAAADWARQ